MSDCGHVVRLTLSLRTLEGATGTKLSLLPKYSRGSHQYYGRRGYSIRSSFVPQSNDPKVKQGSFLSYLNSNHNAHQSTFPSNATSQPGKGSEATFRRAEDRDRYIQLITQYLPSDLEGKVDSAVRQRRLEYNTWQPPSMQRLGREESPFNDWRTALMMLKKHYLPAIQEPSSEEFGIVRQVYSNKYKRGIKNTTHPPEKPSKWTQWTLTTYIYDLINFKPPRPTLFEVLPEDSKRQYLADVTDVAIEIERVLHGTEFRGSMNIHAANIALQYFYDREMMDRARSLYLRMEYLYLNLTSDTWNIILRASASYKDIHNFSFLLDKMIGRGFKPNAVTWSIFVMALGPVDAKRTTIDAMKARGIMDDPKVRRDVATQMVQLEFIDHMEGNSNTQTFFERMRDRYGRDWLSTSTGNILISEVIRYAKGNRRVALVHALRLLYEMKQHSFAANDVTMDMLLRACEGLRVDIQYLLVEVLSIFENLWGLRPGREAHQRLFQIAWRKNRLNFLRTIWASACLNGFVSFQMQDLVLQSVLLNSDETCKPDQPIPFKKLVGWFLVSVDPSKPLPGENAIRWRPDFEERLAVHGVLAVKSNIKTVGQGHLTRGLVVCLRRALVADSAFSSQKLWNTRRKQMALLSKSTQLDINRALDYTPVNKSSCERFRDRLARSKRRRLALITDLRHKRDDPGSLTGIKIGSMAQFSRKGSKELTFRLKRPRHKRRLKKAQILSRIIHKIYSTSYTAKIFGRRNRNIFSRRRKGAFRLAPADAVSANR